MLLMTIKIFLGSIYGLVSMFMLLSCGITLDKHGWLAGIAQGLMGLFLLALGISFIIKTFG